MKMTNMTRRGFIKLTAVSTGVVFAYPLIDKIAHLYPPVQFKNLLFRGTLNGVVQASEDNGKTWSKKMDFGNEIQIIDLINDNEKLVVSLGIGGHSFKLSSDDGQKWMTI